MDRRPILELDTEQSRVQADQYSLMHPHDSRLIY